MKYNRKSHWPSYWSIEYVAHDESNEPPVYEDKLEPYYEDKRYALVCKHPTRGLIRLSRGFMDESDAVKFADKQAKFLQDQGKTMAATLGKAPAFVQLMVTQAMLHDLFEVMSVDEVKTLRRELAERLDKGEETVDIVVEAFKTIDKHLAMVDQRN